MAGQKNLQNQSGSLTVGTTPVSGLHVPKPQTLRLEERFVFDGAGAATAVDAITDASERTGIDAVVAETSVKVAETAPISASSGLFMAEANTPAVVREAIQQTTEQINTWLAGTSQDTLDSVFSNQNSTSLDSVRTAIQQEGADIHVQLLDNNTLNGALAAYTSSGPEGTPTIFLNSDWLSVLNSAQVSRLLLEEYGHHLDNVLNANVDTQGDEGEAFAMSVLGADLSESERARIANENDSATLMLDGVQYSVEEAAITFSQVYEGTPSALSEEASELRNLQQIQGSQFRFVSADPSALYFSGNNVSGNLIYVDANGNTQTIFGVVSRQFKTGSTTEGFYFYADVLQNGIGGANGADDRAFVFVMDTSKFTTGGTYKTSSDPVDTVPTQ